MSAQTLVSQLYKQGIALSVDDNNDLLINAPDGVLTDDLLQQLSEHKQAVITLVKKLADSATQAKASITKRESFPYQCDTSVAQKSLLFIESLAGEQSFYNIPIAYQFNGALSRLALQYAFQQLINQHDILRTIYLEKEGDYVQQICPHTSKDCNYFKIETIDLTACQNKTKALAEQLKSDANYVFQLSQEWPIKVNLIQLAEEQYVLSINIHHIAADGWSANTIVKQLSLAYQCFIKDKLSPLDNTTSQYADYVEWQKEWLESDQFIESKHYWLTSLQNLPLLHSLPTKPRPAVQSIVGDHYQQVLTTTMGQQLSKLAAKLETTVFVLIQSCFAALLARYSGQSDIVFGTAAANRPTNEFIDSVGLFVNTLVQRYQVTEDESFSTLIKQAKSINQASHRHQAFPFDMLVDELQPQRSLGFNPLVQIMLVMQQTQEQQLTLENLVSEPLNQQQKVSKFDVALHVNFDAEAITFNWEYCTALFDQTTIAHLSEHLITLLNACLADQTANYNQVALVNNVESNRQFADKSNFPSPVCIHQLIEQQALLTPNANALIYGETRVTYQELDQRANQLAQYLHQKSDGQIGRIGLCIEKSVELVIGMLAIFKLGGVYVPLDPYYPKERLDHMVADAGINIMLTNQNFELFEQYKQSLLAIDITTLETSAQPNNSFQYYSITAPAYIIYTSGSTGKPKGVLVSHQSLFYSLIANQKALAVTPSDIMPTIGSQAFGVSLLEMLLPLISGGQVHLINKANVSDISDLVTVTKDVTILHAVPSVMRQWLDIVKRDNSSAIYPNLRLLLVGGEPVPKELLKTIRQWRHDIQVKELYGMTESAVVSSSFDVNQHFSLVDTDHAMVNYCIGAPHPNSEFYVLNSSGQQQPNGVPGELHIGGLSLAQEYINNPTETSNRFIAHPFLSGQRLYRTGDRVRCLHDGHYEFLGRVDHQVSLRGARIELGEIEALSAHVAGVKQAVAHIVTLPNDDNMLVLYFSTELGIDSHQVIDAIRRYLAQKLPDYMRPSRIEHLVKFPLNPNGKVDRKLLPLPMISNVIIAPQTDTEVKLRDLWLSLLPLDNISVEDNFFEIGGHSLLASKLITQIRSLFLLDVPLTLIFEAPTIRTCSALIEQQLAEQYKQHLTSDNVVDNSALEDEIII